MEQMVRDARNREHERICDADEVGKYIDVLNGIAWFCVEEGYRPGYRNEIAVNLTVAADMLGFDVMSLLDEFVKAGLIDPDGDDEDTRHRFERVLDYANSFETIAWDWMIDPQWWADRGCEHEEDDDLPIKFVTITR